MVRYCISNVLYNIRKNQIKEKTENAINCVTLFYKISSSIRDFSRKKITKILVQRVITLTLLRERVR